MKSSLGKIFLQGVLAAGVAGVTACTGVTADQETGSSAVLNKSLPSDKEKVVQLLSSIETGDSAPVAYINPDKYIQHNLAVADGLAGFGEVLSLLPQGSAKARVVRVFEDGDYVFAHTEYDFFGPKVGFDIFRFENGKIVEHWDNLQTLAPANTSGRTQLDGPTQVMDLDKTEQNKALVADFVNSILINGEMARVTEFIGADKADYLQHNPSVGDGLAALGEALEAMAKQGMPMSYHVHHKILGEGNFVLSISEGQFLSQHVAFYDLFRVADGKLVEHWDTIEIIPPQSEWKNQNGKFGFQ